MTDSVLHLRQSIPEWHDVTVATFRDEILPAAEPAVLRGAIRDWPAVRAGLESPAAMASYVRAFDTGATVEAMIGDPSIRGGSSTTTR